MKEDIVIKVEFQEGDHNLHDWPSVLVESRLQFLFEEEEEKRVEGEKERKKHRSHEKSQIETLA